MKKSYLEIRTISSDVIFKDLKTIALETSLKGTRVTLTLMAMKFI